MQRHKIGTQAGGVAGMQDICTLLSVGVDPESDYQEYADVVGTDLNGAPIEAGFPQTSWRWSMMPQADFQYLLDFVASTGNGNVYIRTRKNSGASGFDFADYLAVVKRPKSGTRQGLLVRDVLLEFVMLEAA